MHDLPSGLIPPVAGGMRPQLRAAIDASLAAGVLTNPEVRKG